MSSDEFKLRTERILLKKVILIEKELHKGIVKIYSGSLVRKGRYPDLARKVVSSKTQKFHLRPEEFLSNLCVKNSRGIRTV